MCIKLTVSPVKEISQRLGSIALVGVLRRVWSCLPAAQRWKRDCLRAAGMKEPASLTFAPINFERSTLAEALGQAGFRRDAPAFFSWLGVTMYLEEEAIMQPLRFIASLPPGSGVVFDYAVLPSLPSPRERRAMELLAASTSERGEPWKTYFDPAALAGILRSLGFCARV